MIWARNVAGHAGQYQTSLSDTLRYYKRRMENIVNLKTIHREGKDQIMFLRWPAGNW